MKPFFKMPNPIPFTKAGYEKVKQDIEYYSTKRKKAVINLKTAREMGDLSENAAYKAARFELGNIDRQLRNLNYLLRFGVVTEEIRSDIVSFGSRVTLDNGTKKLTFNLVGGNESNPEEHKLSIYSPIGKAIMNKRVGDTVYVTAPMGQIKYTVVTVD